MKIYGVNVLQWWLILVGVMLSFGALGQVDTVKLKAEYERFSGLMEDAYYKGNYSEGVEYAGKALELCESIYGKGHADYGQSLNDLAVLYGTMGRYEEALSLLEEALEVRGKALGKNHADYGESLNNLAVLHGKMGRYEEALPLLEVKGKALGKNHADYGESLGSLAGLYEKMGVYEEALPLLEEALEVTGKALGKNHADYGESLNNLAVLLKKMGRYEEALPMYEQALEVTGKALGKDHANYGKTLNNLALFYYAMGRYEEALPLHEEALEVTGKALGKEHAVYGTGLNNLALFYYAMGRYEEALPMYEQALEVTGKALGKDHANYGKSLNNFAILYEKIGRYEKALPMYEEALEVTGKALGKEHASYGVFLYNLAEFYETMGNTVEFRNTLKQAVRNSVNSIRSQIPYVAESVQNNWLKKYNYRLWKNQSAVFRHPNDGSLIEGMLSYLFLLNNFQLSSKKQLLSGIKTSDPDTKALYQEWLARKKYLARQMSLPIAKRRPDIDSITQVTEQLESKLAAKSKDFAAARRTIDLKNVQENLQANEVLLQFSDFRYFDVNKWTDSTLYIAYLVHANNKAPEMVYLFEQKQLDSLFADASSTSDFYARTFTPVNNKNILNQKLYNLIWKPLLPHLENINTLYINPSGQLHKINLAAIPIDSTSRISDKFKVNYISSARDFVLPKEKKYENTALILGGLDYNEYAPSTDSTAIYYYHDYNEVAVSSNSKNSLRTLRDSTWSPLKGAKIEAKKISRLLSKKSYKIAHLSDKNGTEHAIKYCGRDSIVSPRILHIATHGFSFPVPQDKPKNSIGDENPYRMAEDPLFRSGLILSGANKAWQGQSPPKGQEDGILTAYEISHLDLTETELVVLSACKTGVGDIDSHEGVYGLQRGFKLAGVKYIIMSLWDVPDNETQEMMVLFYKKWLDGGLAIPDAFRAAQEEMREKHERRPELWAGFVLVE